MTNALLSAHNVTKRFPGVVALKDLSFDLQPGEIHALCGENGAGKSTLIKLLSGIHPHGSYEGRLEVNGKEAKFSGIGDSAKEKIAVIYQELALVEEMTVAENIYLGCEPLRWGRFIDWPRMNAQATDLLKRFAVKLDPAALVRSLGVGQKQLVEIVKALAKDSKILILDEPTAALAQHEVVILLDILKDLRARGMSCIYISHKLDEVFAIADRITVLRDGSAVFTSPAMQTNKAEVIKHMVGREITDLFPRRASQPGEPVLNVRNLSVDSEGNPRRRLLRDISFEVRAGEVLGIGGLMGAGRTELFMHLIGASGQRVAGKVELNGQAFAPANPAQAMKAGVALVSEDRRRYGLVLDHDIGFNLSLAALKSYTQNGFIMRQRETAANRSMFDALQIKAPSLQSTSGKLSGGNQQKIVFGKMLLTKPKVILLDEPTRGIDVGAKLEIYEIINKLTSEGVAIVLVSSELPELIGMSDRILMLRQGQPGGQFTRQEATQETLMAAAL